MISVAQAEAIILQNTVQFASEEVSINDALGLILAEDLHADRDFPPFDRVTMDGIAIQFGQLIYQNTFQIEAVSPAGKPQITLQNQANCIEVMTGTMLPANTDTVIRYEDLEIKNGVAKINELPANLGLNVHKKGYDRKQGDVIVPKGRLMNPAEIGIAATVGKTTLKVVRKPKIIIISTGDEIVEIDQIPLPHQIRTSNSYTLQAALRQWGTDTDIILLADNQLLIENAIEQYLKTYDALILSGGASVGKFDYVPKALENQKVEKLFHKVEQRPGKPFWFGKVAQTGKVVFALPGNPVSTFMCLNRYVKSWLEASFGIKKSQLYAELAEDFTFKPDLTYFLQVKLRYLPNSKITAQPVEGHGSGDLANLADSEAFIELPKEKTFFKAGESYPIWMI
jgi:molybdopterin molybdotransferase